uniref:Uncharacterized protein n=1 Tax=Acrobeloides nanus TaxID=290746 RepID=A0A914D135_9BILA
MTPVGNVSDKYLSFTLDSLSAYPETWQYINFSFMVPLAKALAPSYFRFGGTYSDVFVFNETLNGPINQEVPWALTNGFFGNKTTIFSGEQFDTLYNFASNSGWRFIFDLNLMLRNGTGWTEATIHSSRWNSTNAKTLFDYASSKGYEMDWELGN